MKDAISHLAEISRFAARHPWLVQGGGGNCSVKAGPKMAVKASGCFLEEVTEESGYVILETASGTVEGPPGVRPSLEAPLHRLLNRYVIHTHPIALGPLLCSVEGPGAFREIFPEPGCHWVSYANPGRELYETIRRQVQGGSVNLEGDLALFLENHGLFVSSPDKDRCMTLHETLVRRAEQRFPPAKGKQAAPGPEDYFTPDHAVYGALDPARLQGKQKTAVDELDFMAREIHARIAACGWRPRFLTGGAVAAVLGMDEEKYRQDILRKKT